MLMEIQTGNTFQTEAQAGACRATMVHAPPGPEGDLCYIQPEAQ